MKKRDLFQKAMNFIGKKGQSTIAVAVLIILMLVFILIYILSLPPEARNELLNLTSPAITLIPFLLNKK